MILSFLRGLPSLLNSFAALRPVQNTSPEEPAARHLSQGHLNPPGLVSTAVGTHAMSSRAEMAPVFSIQGHALICPGPALTISHLRVSPADTVREVSMAGMRPELVCQSDITRIGSWERKGLMGPTIEPEAPGSEGQLPFHSAALCQSHATASAGKTLGCVYSISHPCLCPRELMETDMGDS